LDDAAARVGPPQEDPKCRISFISMGIRHIPPQAKRTPQAKMRGEGVFAKRHEKKLKHVSARAHVRAAATLNAVTNAWDAYQIPLIRW
jgi:hypothetical protein